MKLRDIIYKLTDKAIMPDKMGIVSVALYDWTKYNYYEDSIPEIDYILHLCEGYNMEAEIENLFEIEAPHGFYRKYVYFFVVEIDKKTDITYLPRIPRGGFERYRHWIDGRIAFIGNEHSVYTISLEKGCHIFCIEYGVEPKYRELFPSVRIESMEVISESLISLTHNNYWYKEKDYIINAKTLFIQESNVFEFSLIPLDLINFDFDSKVRMLIKSEETNSIVFEKDLSFKEEYKIDLSFLSNMGEDEYNWLYAIFEAKDIHGSVFKKSVPIFRYNVNSDYVEDIKIQAEELLKKKQLPELIENELHYYIDQLKAIDKDTYYGKKIKSLFQIMNSKKIEEYLYQAGPHYVYYYSKFDNHYYYYYIVLPASYDPSKKYSLLLTISHGHISDFNHCFFDTNYSNHFYSRKDAIFADIGGRGCTLGSYMGEQFILNELNDILNRFSIDKKRIYVIAHCAGNIALMNLAQAHPHLFAGIYTRRTHLYYPNIYNLYNIPWMHLIASIDESDEFLVHRKQYEKTLRKLNFLFVHKYYNADIELKQVQYTKESIDLLMSKELNDYPEIIYYRTERNRLRKAYYIEIESITEGKNFAEFNSEIVGNNLEINTKNCTGLKITLPPQIDREHFHIKINGKVLSFEKYYEEEVFLRHNRSKRGFEICSYLDENICYYKGTGLLDVYMSPLRVINCNPDNVTMKNACNTFCHPITNTAYSYIYVDYPVITEREITDNICNALIIIDDNCAVDEIINSIRNNLPIQMNSDGYCYKGKTVRGKYCIMQIIANPWFLDKSILYINTNDASLYSRNLFTRTVMIPSYSSGRHPFWNENALLFDGKKYYTIGEWGEDFLEVEL